jgi:hypothetical protein
VIVDGSGWVNRHAALALVIDGAGAAHRYRGGTAARSIV